MTLTRLFVAREKFPSLPPGKLSSASEKADVLQRCVDRLQAHGVDLQGVTAHGRSHDLHCHIHRFCDNSHVKFSSKL